MESEDLFLLKISYTDGAAKFCAYFHHKLQFDELKKFIEYWVFILHEQKATELKIYWIDCEGDRFELKNHDEYLMFKRKCADHAALWVAPSGCYWDLSNQFKETIFTHMCAECSNCGRTKEYTCKETGLMHCTICNHVRGHCCLYVLDGTPCESATKSVTKVATTQKAETAYNSYALANEKVSKIIFRNSDCEDDDDELKCKKLMACLENLIEKDDGDQMSTKSTLVLTSKPDKSTGAMPKRRPQQSDLHFPVPVHVENALHVMMNMGFNNDHGWLTRLLLSTNGKISEALDLINPAQKFKGRIK